MSIQHWGTGSTAIIFPPMMVDNVPYSSQQLRCLHWDNTAGRIVGTFLEWSTDYNLGDAATFWHDRNYRCTHLWRDGTSMDPLVSSPILATNGGTGTATFVIHNNLGQVLGMHKPYDDVVARMYTSNFGGQMLFPLSERWAGALHPVPAGCASIFSGFSIEGSYLLGSATAIVINDNANFQVRRLPSSVSLFRSAGTSWDYPRSLLYVDSGHTAALFMQESAGGYDAAKPALLRMFSTTDTAWSLLWTDTLPASDAVACYDPENKIIYSAGRFAGSTTVIHMSWLKQSPTSMSVITLVSGTTLQELQQTTMSVLVTDSRDAGVCGTLVHWSLSAQAVSGTLLSAWSRTNASGIATVTYIGPRMSANFTERVSAVVATIDPTGDF